MVTSSVFPGCDPAGKTALSCVAGSCADKLALCSRMVQATDRQRKPRLQTRSWRHWPWWDPVEERVPERFVRG